MSKYFVVFFSLVVSGCASIDFDSKEKGLVYFEPKPYLFVSLSDKCISSATVVSIPGEKKKLNFTAGYGSSSLSAEFSNGILTKIGQTSDSKIPETLTSIASLATAGILEVGTKPVCTPSAILYPIENGVPDPSQSINISVGQ